MAYPQPPPLISKFIDSVLRENTALLSSSKAYLDGGSLAQAAGFLEGVHANMMHLGRLADVQTIRHGLPPESTDARADCGLSPRDELLQTFTQALMAHYMKPPQRARAQQAAPADEAAGGGGGGGGSGCGGSSSGGGGGSSSGGGAGEQGSSCGSSSGSSSSSAGAADEGGAAAAASSASSSSSAASAASAAAAAAALPLLAGAAGKAAVPQAKSIAHGKWTLEEVDLFHEGIRLFTEKKPSRIAALIGTRTGEQVRERIKHLRKRGAEGAAAAAPGKGGGGGGGSEEAREE